MGFGLRGANDQTRQMIRELAQARPVTDAQRQYLTALGPNGTTPTGHGSVDIVALQTRGWCVGGVWGFHSLEMLSGGMLIGD